MASGEEALIVRLTAKVGQYEKEMRAAGLIADATAGVIERRFGRMENELDRTGQSAARKLAAPLAAIGTFITAREVLDYADAWKRAGNSLRTANVPAGDVAATLERLYGISQDASAPLEATTQLFGRLSQSATELGATREQLFAFSEGVGDALKVAGTSAGAASGALLQLSQALGSSVVRAEEFNSINEGARPILQAVAAGIEEAGGSVSKLRQIVVDGRLTNKAFFDAFLIGAEGLGDQADAAAQTVEQAYVRIGNALTRYIGQTDEGLSATNRLIAGLNAFADNFDVIADSVLKLASAISGALVGRSLAQFGVSAAQTILISTALISALARIGPAGAIAGAGMDRAALGVARFTKGAVTATAASRVLRFAMIGLAAGPVAGLIGAVIGLAGGFIGMSGALDTATAASREHERALDEIRGRTEEARFASQERRKELRAAAEADLEAAEAALTHAQALAQLRLQQARDLAAPIEGQAAGFAIPQFGTDENGRPTFGANPDAFAANNKSVSEAQAEVARLEEVASAAKTAVADIDRQLEAGSKALTSGAPSKGSGRAGTKTAAARENEFERAVKSIRERTAAQEIELRLVGEREEAAERLRAAFELENAAKEAGIALTPALKAEIDALAGSYAAATTAVRDAEEAQNDAQARMEAVRSTARDALGGFVSDLRDGKSATDALANSLDKIADKLLDLALDQTIAALFGLGGESGGVGGLGKILGSLFGGKRERGGPVSAGRAYLVGEKGPELIVPPSAAAVIPNDRLRGGATSVSMPITIDARGADSAGLERVRAELTRLRQEVPGMAVGAVGEYKQRGGRV